MLALLVIWHFFVRQQIVLAVVPETQMPGVVVVVVVVILTVLASCAVC